MQTFLKEAKRKEKWMTFARIHRLACQQNNLPCAPSILKHHVSAEVCLLGHRWISRGFILTRYLGEGSVASISAKPKDSLDTLITQEMREDLQIDFSRETFFGCSLGPYRETSVSKIYAPKMCNRK